MIPQQEQLRELRELQTQHPDKTYEILEGEVREVVPNEGKLIRENPDDFPPSVQRKYFGTAKDDWQFPESYESEEIPEGYFISSRQVTNPYTKESRVIHTLEMIPVPLEPTSKEIGDKILHEVFDNNPHAQIADLTKSQVTMLALLVPIIGKETIRTTFGDIIETLDRVSEARVAQGLTSFDLSFLD